MLKAWIPVLQDASGTSYLYPDVWLQNKEKFPFIVYPATRGDEVEEGNKKFQPVFVCVPDDLVDAMKAVGLEDADRAEFETFSNRHYPVKERIDDLDAVIPILAHVARGNPLTEKQLRALDPEDPTPGLSKTKSCLEVADVYGVTWQ